MAFNYFKFDRVAEAHKQAWTKKVYANNYLSHRESTDMLAIVYASLALLCFAFMAIPGAGVLLAAIYVSIFTLGAIFSILGSRFGANLAHAPKTPVSLVTLGAQPGKAYTSSNHLHALPAQYQDKKGSEAKRAILAKFKNELDACTDLDSLQEKINQQIHSKEYLILATGQGLTTRFFELKTSSQRAYQAMCGEKGAKFYVAPAEVKLANETDTTELLSSYQ